MAYTKLENGKYITGNIKHTEEWEEILKDSDGNITSPLGLVEQIENERQESFISQYKSYYLELFNSKLKELDYDSIATLSMWANKDNSIYQEEAQVLLDWYDLLVSKNYEIINSIKKGTLKALSKEEYLEALPAYE